MSYYATKKQNKVQRKLEVFSNRLLPTLRVKDSGFSLWHLPSRKLSGSLRLPTVQLARKEL